MKKLLTFLMFFLLATIAVQVQAETSTFTFANLGYSNGADFSGTTDGYVNLEADGGTNTSNSPKYYNTGSGIRLYVNNTLKVEAVSGTITSIVFTYSGTSYTGTMEPSVGSYSLSSTTGTWTGSSTSVTFTNTGGTNRIQKIVVTYSGGSTTPSIALNATSVDFGTVAKGATVEAKTIAATLTNVSSATATLSGDGASAFTISPTTLTSSGNITITPATTTAGTYSATLTLSATGATSVTAEISMIVEEPFEGTITTLSAADDADIKFVSGSNSETGAFWVNSTPLTANDLTLSGSNGSATSYSYYDGSVVRFYKNNTFTITPAEGVTIVKIEIIRSTSTYSNSGTINCDNLTAYSGNTTTNTNVYTGSTDLPVTFSNDAQARFTAIKVYTLSTSVKKPVISPNGGEFEGTQDVTITAEDGCTIYYTTDGTTPTTSSTQYTGVFAIDAACTVKAIAVNADGEESTVASAQFLKIIHVKNIAEFNALENNTPAIFDNPVVVLYDFSQRDQYNTYQEYIWVQDESGRTEIFVQPSFDNVTQVARYENGDVIPAGFKVTNYYYGVGMFYEAKSSTGEGFQDATMKALAAPADIDFVTFTSLTIADDNSDEATKAQRDADAKEWSNRFVFMKNVTFTLGTGDSYNRTYSITHEGTTADITTHMLYNKFDDAGAKMKDGSSATVTVPEGTEQTYNVYGIVQLYKGKWEFIPLIYDPYVEETLTLKELVDKGNKGDTNTTTVYTIDNALQVVTCYTDRGTGNNIMLVKDDNGNAVNMVYKNEGDEDFLIKAESFFTSQDIKPTGQIETNEKAQADYDQSNWLEVVLPASISLDDAKALINTIIPGKSFVGNYVNTVNPRMNLTATSLEASGTASPYYRNPMTPANFMSKSVAGNDQKNYFFMTPKPNEFVQVVYAVNMSESGVNHFYLPTSNYGNVHEFAGNVAVGSYNYNVVDAPELVNKQAYQFMAVVKAPESTSASTSRKVGSQFDPQTCTNVASYTLYPINLQDVEGIVTGVDGVATAKAVKRVRFYNVAGVAFGEAQPGINIVVTEYTDGSHSTAKVIR